MRIIYVAKHEQANSNDDEGAIHHALTSLGHDVQRVREVVGHRADRLEGDLLLFHKWDDAGSLARLKRKMKTAFWYFDLVEFPSDPTLAGRDRARRAWMERTLPLVDVGFCTDGDWVAKHPDKLVWLPQGADQRIVGRGQRGTCCLCGGPAKEVDLLFVGIGKGGGVGRASFVEEMRERYGERFLHVAQGIHGRALADLVANAKLVLCPDSPVTDRYWSNRVYQMLGFGARLLHPESRGLRETLGDAAQVFYYRDREHLHAQVAWWSSVLNVYPNMANDWAEAALTTAKNGNLYVHRCQELLGVVKERFGLT